MNIPNLQGKLDQNNFFIYAAADPVYFDLYGRPLINSIQTNVPNLGVHLHIYNARPDQIEFCQSKSNVSCSWEEINDLDFDHVTQAWLNRSRFENERQREMYKKGQKFGRDELKKLIKNTYYASVRFIRLAELLSKKVSCLSIDVDGIVRRPFNWQLDKSKDFYLYEKPKDGTHLAGAILFNGTDQSWNFVQEYSQKLRQEIAKDNIYWFLDQVILDQVVVNYKKGVLPMSYIDWAMRPDSSIWTAKGKRKYLDIFQQELKKYNG